MITRLTAHDDHQIMIHPTKPMSKHHAALRCVKCNKHIQWLSKTETEKMVLLGVGYYNKE